MQRRRSRRNLLQRLRSRVKNRQHRDMPGADEVDSRHPFVVAHRGASASRPEHTLAAYDLALREGADGLECDVRLTRDGHLVCVHDRRLDRTSNGRGLVSNKTLAQLETLDFGSWHAAAEGDESSTRLLTLERLLSAIRDHGRPVRLLSETNAPSSYGG